MPKITRRSVARSSLEKGEHSSLRHAPLGHVMEADEIRAKYAAPARRCRQGRKDANVQDDDDDDEAEDEEMLDEKTSKRILELSREQQLEIETERLKEARRKAATTLAESRNRDAKKAACDGEFAPPGSLSTNRKIGNKSNNDDDYDDDDDDDDSVGVRSMAAEEDDDDYEEIVERDDAGYVTVVEDAPGLSAADEAVVASMMGNNGEERRTLADIIMEKIREKEEQQRRAEMGDTGDEEEEGVALPPKVVEVYTEIGKILSRYTSGKLPKAFKVIPALSNWEEVLYLTRPDLWTPQAMYAATRIFASNLNPKMAQRFYNLVLLDSVRADIVENRRLNYHYFMALKKAVYKPAAFFKGILLPLCMENCTLREAAIVSAVVQRVSIPVHHSAVAIHKLAQLGEYSGAASIFLKTLLQKKYSLPAPVIGSMVQHFASFVDDDRELPVLWHQCLLVFAQRYKNVLKDEAREALKVVMKKHFHCKITPEIRRELFGAQAWKEERAAAAAEQAKGNDMDL